MLIKDRDPGLRDQMSSILRATAAKIPSLLIKQTTWNWSLYIYWPLPNVDSWILFNHNNIKELKISGERYLTISIQQYNSGIH